MLYDLYPTRKQQEILDLIYKYLGRIYSHKLLENTKPAIYYLSYSGIANLRERKKFELKDVKKFYEDKNKSQTFVNHCITIMDFVLKAKKKEDPNEYTFTFLSKEELSRHGYLKDMDIFPSVIRAVKDKYGYNYDEIIEEKVKSKLLELLDET